MKRKLIVILLILFTQNRHFVKAKSLKAGPNVNIGIPDNEIGVFSQGIR